MDGEPTATEPAVTPAAASVQPGWIRIVALIALIAAFGFIVVRFVKKDVVTIWTRLASCQTVTDIGANRVSATLDTTSCLVPPSSQDTNTGWQVVTFVLPAEVGSDPRITKITSNQATRDMAIEYDSPPRSKGGDTGGNTLVFVELPPGEVPPTPFTIHDADGVTTVIAAAPTDSGE